MKKKTSKSQKSTEPTNYGEGKPGTAGGLLAAAAGHSLKPAGGFGPILHPIEDLHNPLLRIVVVVAENPQWWESTGQGSVQKSKKLETGRAMAQAVHAASQLKLYYVTWASQQQTEKAYEFTKKVADQPITCICVKARDSNELRHISQIALNNNLLVSEFADENPGFYKTLVHPVTAIAIGPYTPEHFSGITDYLPLWKSPDEV